eukprot:1521748-Amphidinium_carterae.2
MACHQGCGHAVDLLHAFLIKTLQCAGPKVEVRKYVDDMVLVGKGKTVQVCQAHRRVRRNLTQANMKVNLKRTVVLCNGAKTKRLVKKVWKTGRLPPLKVTTRDLGVDTHTRSVGRLALSCATQTGHDLQTGHDQS